MKRKIVVLLTIFVALLVSFSTAYIMTASGDANRSENSNDNFNNNGNSNDDDDDNGNSNFNNNGNGNGNENSNGNDNLNGNDNDNGNGNGNDNDNDNSNNNGYKTKVRGKIKWINNNRFVIKNETIVVTPKTKFKGSASSLADLGVDDRVKVKGKRRTNGTIKARMIKKR